MYTVCTYYLNKVKIELGRALMISVYILATLVINDSDITISVYMYLLPQQ